jgi:hypothetical protein
MQAGLKRFAEDDSAWMNVAADDSAAVLATTSAGKE